MLKQRKCTAGSPKGKKRSGGLDVEAEECTEKVQKERSRSGGLDVEAEECTEEVQKKKICTWKQPPGRRLFPQIEVIS